MEMDRGARASRTTSFWYQPIRNWVVGRDWLLQLAAIRAQLSLGLVDGDWYRDWLGRCRKT